MPRPRKDTAERREEQIKLRLTLAELEHLRTQAERAGLSTAEYGRRRILGHEVSPRASRADAALVSELNRIGVNVNQLARAAHTDPDATRDWRFVLTELRQVLAKVAGIYDS